MLHHIRNNGVLNDGVFVTSSVDLMQITLTISIRVAILLPNPVQLPRILLNPQFCLANDTPNLAHAPSTTITSPTKAHTLHHENDKSVPQRDIIARCMRQVRLLTTPLTGSVVPNPKAPLSNFCSDDYKDIMSNLKVFVHDPNKLTKCIV